MKDNKKVEFLYIIKVKKPRTYVLGGKVIDFGENLEKIIKVEKKLALDYIRVYPSLFRIVNPSIKDGFKYPALRKEDVIVKAEDTVKEHPQVVIDRLSKQLIDLVGKPGLFLHGLREAIMEKYDIPFCFPISCTLTDEDLIRTAHSRGYNVFTGQRARELIRAEQMFNISKKLDEVYKEVIKNGKPGPGVAKEPKVRKKSI
ncbi:hypothetical protein H8E77_12705 [bacterium]|nr:hypothetical protein [bacterium]